MKSLSVLLSLLTLALGNHQPQTDPFAVTCYYDGRRVQLDKTYELLNSVTSGRNAQPDSPWEICLDGVSLRATGISLIDYWTAAYDTFDMVMLHCSDGTLTGGIVVFPQYGYSLEVSVGGC